MNVRELISTLSELDQELLVIIAKDPEGNDYSPWDNTFAADYVAVNTWSGFLLDEDLDPDYYEDYGDDAVPCVVLVPVN